MECVSSHWLPRACIKSRSGKFNQIHCAHPPRRTVHHARNGFFFSPPPPSELVCCDIFCGIGKRRTEPGNKTMKERRNTQPLVVRCKLVLVGDVQCGKTAMLQVLAKDCYPEVIPEKKNTSKYLHNFCVCLLRVGFLLKRLKMAEESVRTLQINHAQFPNTSPC